MGVSRAWWLLPVFLGVFGGIVAWIFTRKKERWRWVYIPVGLGFNLFWNALIFSFIYGMSGQSP